jgi:hypothetical protein
MLTVHFDDAQVAAAMVAVELFMEHDDTPLANIDLLRQHIDRLVAA